MSLQFNEHDQQRIDKVIHDLNAKRITSDAEVRNALDLLEAYECWHPFTTLISGLIENPSKRKFAHYARLASVQNLQIDDIFSAAETCAKAVKDLSLSFDHAMQLLREIIVEEDWSSEALVLQSISQNFSKKNDKIACYERLALLYEKKLHDPDELRKTYESILQIDAYNTKALRYQKLIHTQNNEWGRAVEIMRKLIKTSRHPHDVYRLAQELASVYLYHLDKPQKAIDIIETHCSDSPLDTSMIHYDAYERLGNLDSCIKVIESCLLRVDDNQGKGVLLYRAGTLQERKNCQEKAIDYYKKSIDTSPNFLEPYERLAAIYAHEEKWAELRITLENFKAKLSDAEIIENIEALITRLKTALSEQTHA